MKYCWIRNEKVRRKKRLRLEILSFQRIVWDENFHFLDWKMNFIVNNNWLKRTKVMKNANENTEIVQITSTIMTMLGEKVIIVDIDYISMWYNWGRQIDQTDLICWNQIGNNYNNHKKHSISPVGTKMKFTTKKSIIVVLVCW